MALIRTIVNTTAGQSDSAFANRFQLNEMASQSARNASELTMAVHSVAVRALDTRFEDLLGIMALTKG
jgi:hypothetical protein